jgi:cytochrome c553
MSNRYCWLALWLLPSLTLGAEVSQLELQAALRARPEAQRGEQLFLACAACHASDGSGSRDGSVPVIAGQHRRVIIKQLVDFRHSKRWDIRMERYSSDHVLINAQDIASIAAYVSDLPVIASSEVADTSNAHAANNGDGARLYERVCASCHGASAEGTDASRVPRMAAQSAQYLLRQMHYAIEERRPNFSREHVALLKRVEFADLERIAGFVSGIRPLQ